MKTRKQQGVVKDPVGVVGFQYSNPHSQVMSKRLEYVFLMMTPKIVTLDITLVTRSSDDEVLSLQPGTFLHGHGVSWGDVEKGGEVLNNGSM